MRRFIPIIVIFAVIISLSMVIWPRQSAFAASTLDMTQKYKIVNQSSGLVLGISGGVATAGVAAVQTTDNGATDHLWRFITSSGPNYKIENVSSGAILAIAGGSKNAGAAVVQWGDNGTNDHIWQFNATGNGSYKIVNGNSGLELSISGGGTAVQTTVSSASNHLWKLVAAGTSYPNPIALSGDNMIRDPSIIKLANGTYYAFSTSIAIPYIGLEIRSSTDQIHFVNAGPVFKKVPAWTNAYDANTPDLWAPDISYHNGTYWLYYAVSTFGSETSAIGLATSTTATPGSWADQGIVYTSVKGDGYNAIDPCLVIDSSGKYWLSLGSGWTGIELIQINPATGKQLASNTIRYHIANRTTSKVLEASYIYPHGGYYYLFASVDTCCDAKATYHIIVGRSTIITGPYTDKGGLAMLQGGGTIILSTHGNIVGPGGESVMTDGSSTVIDYQYHDANNSGLATLGINLLGWDAQGWPYIQ